MASHKNVLMVEGRQDKFVIPELIEASGVNWGTRQNPVVFIRDYDGYKKLVDPLEISTALKDSGLNALGIMVDADGEHLKVADLPFWLMAAYVIQAFRKNVLATLRCSLQMSTQTNVGKA